MLSSQHLAEGLDDGTLEVVPCDELPAPFHTHVTEETATLVDDFVHGKSPFELNYNLLSTATVSGIHLFFFGVHTAIIAAWTRRLALFATLIAVAILIHFLTATLSHDTFS